MLARKHHYAQLYVEGSKYKTNPQIQACEMYLFISTGLSFIQDLGRISNERIKLNAAIMRIQNTILLNLHRDLNSMNKLRKTKPKRTDSRTCGDSV